MNKMQVGLDQILCKGADKQQRLGRDRGRVIPTHCGGLEPKMYGFLGEIWFALRLHPINHEPVHGRMDNLAPCRDHHKWAAPLGAFQAGHSDGADISRRYLDGPERNDHV